MAKPAKKAAAKPVDKLETAKAETKAKFAEADAKGEPDIEAIQAGLSVRGY